jgi:hypothetical protein
MTTCLTIKRLVLLSITTYMLVATALPVGAITRIPEWVTPDQLRLAQQLCREEEANRKLEPLWLKGD